MTPRLIAALAVLPGAVALAHGAWWSVLALAALRRPAPAVGGAGTRFTVIVPAHNEELLVGGCVRSLLAAQCDPAPEVVVVADNCGDATAAVAARAGATVIERVDVIRRGKSWALDFAIEHLRARPAPPEVVVVVDADSTVSGSFFAGLADQLERGARVCQAYYVAAGGDASLTRLRRLAFMLVHWARALGASRMGLGVGLKGNGMAFRWEVARAGLGGAGLAEDADSTLALARRGIAVAFAPGAQVSGFMAATYGDAAVQDQRWEGGRAALISKALATAAVALRRGRVDCAAAALEVASLPLSIVAALALLGAAISALGAAPAWLGAAAAASVVTYAAAGWTAARASAQDLLALAEAPRFVLHKLGVYAALIARRGPASWERTARK